MGSLQIQNIHISTVKEILQTIPKVSLRGTAIPSYQKDPKVQSLRLIQPEMVLITELPRELMNDTVLEIDLSRAHHLGAQKLLVLRPVWRYCKNNNYSWNWQNDRKVRHKFSSSHHDTCKSQQLDDGAFPRSGSITFQKDSHDILN